MAEWNELFRIFARSIHAKSRALSHQDLTTNQRKRLSASITADIRTCGGLIFPDVKAPEVSKAAHQKAKAMGVQLCEKDWHDQPAFDRGRRVFQWEHVNPVACIKKKCVEANTVDEVVKILMKSLRIAWILKEEDTKLNDLGYRHDRPDSDDAYREAGIVLKKFNK